MLHGIWRLFVLQVGLTAIVTAVFAIVWSIKAGISALLGGVIHIGPSIIFAWMLFRHHGAHAAKKILSGFYLGEALKLLLTGCLLAVVFLSIPVQALPFFVSFILVQFTYWFAPWIIQR